MAESANQESALPEKKENEELINAFFNKLTEALEYLNSLTRESKSDDRKIDCAIFWDMDNVHVPKELSNHMDSVISAIRTKLYEFTFINAITSFDAYCDCTRFKATFLESARLCNVDMNHAAGGKNAADLSIIADVFTFALKNPPPSNIVLISGDVDFSKTIRNLVDRGHNIVLIVPQRRNVNNALLNSTPHVVKWDDILRSVARESTDCEFKRRRLS